jgi:adenosylhomocysteine nucleosidase
MSTTILFENFDIEGVVNIGTAGGLREDQEVLDVVISNIVAHHDMDISVFGYPLGFDQDYTAYKADDKYIEIMKNIIEKEDRVFIGNIASGDSFIHREDQIELINKNFPGALCAEMEAAGIAQVCKHYKKPFIVIRSLSDITIKEGNDLDFNTYVSLASKRSALWCEKFIEELKNQA